MTDLDKLVSDATSDATTRGHDLGPWTLADVHVGRRSTACRLCPAYVHVTTHPFAGMPNVSGPAVDQRCTRSYERSGIARVLWRLLDWRPLPATRIVEDHDQWLVEHRERRD